jgi:hypothetical protein
MNTLGCRMLASLMVFCHIACSVAWAQSSGERIANQPAPMRAPAVPLIACDPYFSVWSPASKLTDADTVHWTGKPHRLTSLASIDGKTYRLIERDPVRFPALEQTSASIRPTQTVYRLAGAGVDASSRLVHTCDTGDVAFDSGELAFEPQSQPCAPFVNRDKRTR